MKRYRGQALLALLLMPGSLEHGGSNRGARSNSRGGPRRCDMA